ncbi:helix-turn-helix domain-containing protein [Chitinophaga tropicalis]|uniref:Helix-turn-helix domain-containing protein n=1 Tax=Chitinophaga tropicalis TaxID=2683588 RepID=A0A7K1U1M7_9BACT|nr:helix-turn-helix domain-containing protein [Chitinophaga tropicalis]MVT08271.1 helix-turn-helix domain-containing protein [Chitinophaga tropicalis]
MAAHNLVVKDLHELYTILGLPLDAVDVSSGFTIHFLQQTFTELPFTSVPYRPDYFSFLFIREAYGRYAIDDQCFDVKPGTVYFTNPGNYRVFEWHSIKDACLITFNEAYLKENVHQDVYRDFSFLLTETVLPRVLSEQQFEMLRQLYQQIHTEYLGQSPYRNKIIGSLMVVLLLKIKEYFFQDYNPIYEGNRSSQIVKTFRRDLEQHFRDLVAGKAEMPLRVQDYADMQSLHVNYLSSVISSKTGRSISAWIADKTVAEARVMLRKPGISIKEIAGRLGFLEASHFSNYFKKHTSVSPAEYRKQHAS